MADATVLKTKIKLRRDTEANYESVKDSFVPLAGEVCLVVTDLYGLRAKVGNGSSAYKDLAFTDINNNVVIRGYLLNNEFYKDSTYQASVKYAKCDTHIYIDANAGYNKLYLCDGSNYIPVSPEATESIPGVMKLYKTHGSNEDGTMTQKSITDGVNAIKFAVSSTDTECLVLDLPWA